MKRLFPPIASALLLSLAFAPFSLMLLVFVAPVPWLVQLHALAGETRWKRQAFSSGLWFGLVFFGGQTHWLQTLTGRWTGSAALGVLPWGLLTIYLALFGGLLGVLIALAFRSRLPWAIPFLWAGVEVIRSFVPGMALPWGLLATPLWRLPALIQPASLGGIYLVSAWVMLGATLIAGLFYPELPLRSRRAVLLFVMVGLGSWVRFQTPLAGEKIAVTIGQPGVDRAFGSDFEFQQGLAEAIPSFYAQASQTHARFLVLPEGLADAGSGLQPRTSFPIDPSVPVLFGGQRGRGPVYQSAFAHEAGRWQAVDKTRLVMFGEYVPARDRLPFLKHFHLGEGDLQPGEKTEAVDLGGVRIGPLICFESLFSDIASKQAQNGVQLLAVMSIDDWYMGTAAPDQLRAASVWRAVETGLPLVRSATLGYSLAVDGQGRILTEAPLRQRIALHAELHIPEAPRPFRGFWVFPILSAALCVGLPIYARLNARRAAKVD